MGVKRRWLEQAEELVRLADLRLGAGEPHHISSELRRALPDDHDLRGVDGAVRRLSADGFEHWAATGPDACVLAGQARDWPVVHALAMHPDGRVREAAVPRGPPARGGTIDRG